jgi:hypothetical protein
MDVTATTATTVATRRWPPSAIVLLVANVLPLIGVLTHTWTVFAVLLLYWFENVTVGVFNALRLSCAQPQSGLVWAGKGFLVPFFLFHYGMFTYVHGVFVFSLFGPKVHGHALDLSVAAVYDALRGAGLLVAAVALVASHGFSFFHNFLAGGEYRRVGLPQLMLQPYARVMLLHVTILIGGFLVSALGSPVVAVVLLVALKTAIDLRAHLGERRKLSGDALRPATPAA